MDEIEVLRLRMSLKAAITERSLLKSRIAYLEDTALPHARKQSHADGFQVGWHAALKRVEAEDPIESLRNACPLPSEREGRP